MLSDRVLAFSAIVVLAVLLLAALITYLLTGGNPDINAAISNTFAAKVVSWADRFIAMPEFNAKGTDANISSINITHEGIDRIGNDTTPTPGPTLINRSIVIQNRTFIGVKS